MKGHLVIKKIEISEGKTKYITFKYAWYSDISTDIWFSKREFAREQIGFCYSSDEKADDKETKLYFSNAWHIVQEERYRVIEECLETFRKENLKENYDDLRTTMPEYCLDYHFFKDELNDSYVTYSRSIPNSGYPKHWTTIGVQEFYNTVLPEASNDYIKAKGRKFETTVVKFEK